MYLYIFSEKNPSGGWYVTENALENLTEKRSFEGECDNFEDNVSVKDLISRHTSKPERAIILL